MQDSELLICKHHWKIDHDGIGVCRYCSIVRQFDNTGPAESFSYPPEYDHYNIMDITQEGEWDNIVGVYENTRSY